VWKPLSSFVCFSDSTTAATAWRATLACGRDLLCFPCRRERGDYADETPFCEVCQKHREYFKFHPDMLKAWEQSPNPCENASDAPEACKKERDPGLQVCCLQCAAGCNKTRGRGVCTASYFCHGCDENRPEYQFVEEHLVAIAAGQAEVQSRLCAYCVLQARTDLDDTKRYQCTACDATKHIRDFSPADQKEYLIGKGYFKWVCYDCRFTLCEGSCKTADDIKKANRRPQHAVPHNAFLDGRVVPLDAFPEGASVDGRKYYFCHACKYPPCSGGCEKARGTPAKKKRALSIASRRGCATSARPSSR
jgi:hypothetical protein